LIYNLFPYTCFQQTLKGNTHTNCVAYVIGKHKKTSPLHPSHIKSGLHSHAWLKEIKFCPSNPYQEVARSVSPLKNGREEIVYIIMRQVSWSWWCLGFWGLFWHNPQPFQVNQGIERIDFRIQIKWQSSLIYWKFIPGVDSKNQELSS
jgi:hypothetical protein